MWSIYTAQQERGEIPLMLSLPWLTTLVLSLSDSWLTDTWHGATTNTTTCTSPQWPRGFRWNAFTDIIFTCLNSWSGEAETFVSELLELRCSSAFKLCFRKFCQRMGGREVWKPSFLIPHCPLILINLTWQKSKGWKVMDGHFLDEQMNKIAF